MRMFSMIAVHIDNKQDGLDWQTRLTIWLI